MPEEQTASRPAFAIGAMPRGRCEAPVLVFATNKSYRAVEQANAGRNSGKST